MNKQTEYNIIYIKYIHGLEVLSAGHSLANVNLTVASVAEVLLALISSP